MSAITACIPQARAFSTRPKPIPDAPPVTTGYSAGQYRQVRMRVVLGAAVVTRHLDPHLLNRERKAYAREWRRARALGPIMRPQPGEPTPCRAPPVTNAFGTHELLRFDYARTVAEEPGTVDGFDQGLLNAIDRHGFAVIENAVDGADCDRLVAEMRPFIDATPHGLHGLGGNPPRRCAGRTIAREPQADRPPRDPSPRETRYSASNACRGTPCRSTARPERARRASGTRGNCT